MDRGYISPQFVTNNERLLATFDNVGASEGGGGQGVEGEGQSKSWKLGRRKRSRAEGGGEEVASNTLHLASLLCSTQPIVPLHSPRTHASMHPCTHSSMHAVLQVRVLVTDQKIESIRDVVPILEQVSAQKLCFCPCLGFNATQRHVLNCNCPACHPPLPTCSPACTASFCARVCLMAPLPAHAPGCLCTFLLRLLQVTRLNAPLLIIAEDVTGAGRLVGGWSFQGFLG